MRVRGGAHKFLHFLLIPSCACRGLHAVVRTSFLVRAGSRRFLHFLLIPSSVRRPLDLGFLKANKELRFLS